MKTLPFGLPSSLLVLSALIGPPLAVAEYRSKLRSWIDYESLKEYEYSWENSGLEGGVDPEMTLSNARMGSQLRVPTDTRSTPAENKEALEHDFFFNYLETQFRYATRGLLKLEVKVLARKDFPTDYNYSSSDFLSLPMFDSADYSAFSGQARVHCETNRTFTQSRYFGGPVKSPIPAYNCDRN
jgi:hypothetical protein